MLNRTNKVLKHLVSICVTWFLRNVAKQCRVPAKRGIENNDLRGSEKAYVGIFNRSSNLARCYRVICLIILGLT
jgi:hypothetical protein